VHGSVCRDHLEPATACAVHHGLHLPEDCVIYDVSNACLGLLNGMLQVATMIEARQIRAGLVVGTESGRPLVETTIDQLNRDTSLTRAQMKLSVASLTIGSGSCAMLLVDRELSRTGNRLTCGVARAFTTHHELCHNAGDDAIGAGMTPLMDTDSERLLLEGVEAAGWTFEVYLRESAWRREDVDKTFCHQVGAAHRKLLFERLELSPTIDFPTVSFLGNMGSVSLPITMAMGIEQGWLHENDRVSLLGIGSGINVVMAGVEWRRPISAA
jgi:3-oxoacyl-[acyl-carrier-protein] synthase-3